MLNWGDTDVADRLAIQLKELLRDRTMTLDQLASCYSIKHGQSVTQRLKEISRDRRPMSLADFIAQMSDHFEDMGQAQVRARGATRTGAVPGSATAPAPAAPVARTAPAARPALAVRAAAAVPAPATAPAPAAPATAPVAKEAVAATARVAAALAAAGDRPEAVKNVDASRGIQNILKEQHEPVTVDQLEQLFQQKFRSRITDVVGMPTAEYLQRKDNIFDFTPSRGTVFLQSTMLAGPPMADPSTVKDETFVVREFEQLIEAMGPVVYISTLCGKFIQRNGLSVTSVINTRPLDLFKRHPGVFLIVGAGNVTLKKYEHAQDVQRLLDKPSSKAQRIAKAAEEAQLPIPEAITEQHVVEEFRRLILADSTDSVYISSLCGRFLQRFKKPVTAIISCKPAELLRRYPEVFVMTGGGNVGLKEVLGPDAVSVPPPPPRVPKALRDDYLSSEALAQIELTDQVYRDIHTRVAGSNCQAVVQRLTAIARQIEQASFLALEEVVLGGAAGKGLLTTGPQAEIVLVVRQLPYRNFAQWLPHILDTLVPVLEHQLAAQRAEKLRAEKDHLQFQLRGEPGRDLTVHIYISPVFKSREHLLESIRNSPPAERLYFYPAMVKERNGLVGGQPQDVKVLIRLMTWWVSKQTWTTAFTMPSDWLVELIVIYACSMEKGAGDGGGVDLARMVKRILDTCGSFESAKILWADTAVAMYQQQDIWRPLLSHEPLFMDPLNPFCNLADANSFDARDLATAAKQLDRLDAFKREAARFLKAFVRTEGETYEDEDEYEDAQDCESG